MVGKYWDIVDLDCYVCVKDGMYFVNNKAPIGSDINYVGTWKITPPSYLMDEEKEIYSKWFVVDRLYSGDTSFFVEGDTYSIADVNFLDCKFSLKDSVPEYGTFDSASMTSYSCDVMSDTFVYTETLINSENPEIVEGTNLYADCFPIQPKFGILVGGKGADVWGFNCINGTMTFTISYTLRLKVINETAMGIWHENNPGEEFPEGEVYEPQPDSGGSSGSGSSDGSTDLKPIIKEIENSTETVVSEIEKQTETYQEEIQNQTSVLENHMIEQKQELEEQTEILEEQKENEKNFFGSFFENLIETIKSLFIPSDEEMQSLLDELMTFFSDKFGFLFFPFELLGQALEIFKTDGSTGLTFPSFSIMGYEIWPDLTYDITSNEITNNVFVYVRYATGAMLAMWFINYLRNFFDKRFGGGGN